MREFEKEKVIPGLPETIEDAIEQIEEVETSPSSEWIPLETVEYYFNEVEKGIAELESQGLWGREQSDAVMNEHLRTPYNY